MASGLEALYQQVILDHAREKHGHGLGEASDGKRVLAAESRVAESRQYNPLCGDEVTLRVTVNDAVVADLAWAGEGCSISQAATSVLHDLVVGRSVEQARSIVGNYREMVRSRGRLVPDEEVLGDAVAFAGVGRHANRVKCAMLGWTAFEDALRQSGTDLAGAEVGEGEPG
jgi:nitrogen fixation NifU-like protein